MKPQIYKISPIEVWRSRSYCQLVDVRTPGEFGSSCIDGSVSHPLDDLDAAEIERDFSNQKRCVLICQSGKRAKQAAEKLRDSNLPAVYIMQDGINAWKARGLPLIYGPGRIISLERQVRIGAGLLVLIGAVLGYWVNPLWIFLSGLVGGGLVFAGTTDTCGMGLLLARMPWNKGCNPSNGACPSEKTEGTL